MNKRMRLGATVLGVSAIVGAVIYITNPFGDSSTASRSNLSQIFVTAPTALSGNVLA